ncbi:MAG: ribonuclease P protein component [Metamycoplasmataceae bacterium]
MSKLNILKKNWEFQSILNTKKQIVSQYLILYYQPTNQNFVIGISIPKKFANAVKRNYLKRQIKVIIKNSNYFSLKYRVVLIIRKDFINLTFKQKEEAILKLIERLTLNGKNKKII